MNNPRVIYEENMITEETTGLSILKKNQLEFLKTTFPLYVLQCLGGKIEMAHSLESRLPFLDIALISYALSLPDHYHLFGMREKNLLRLAFDATIPRLIFGRIKQGYTAPIIRIFLNQKRPAFFDHFLLSQETISAYNIFSYKDIQKTLKIIQYTTIDQQTMTLLERKLMLVLCTHLLYDMFLSNKPHKVPNYH
jgi:asparagine synthetase B (glutamine-hydrolysing)